MDKFIYNAFQNLPERDVPSSLHASVVRAALFSRVLKYITVITFVASASFVLSLLHLHTRLLETEAITTFKAVMSTLDFSAESILDSTRTLIEFLPIQAIMFATLNFIALIFLVLLLQSFKRLEGKFSV